jgi:hypothetical protein
MFDHDDIEYGHAAYNAEPSVSVAAMTEFGFWLCIAFITMGALFYGTFCIALGISTLFL